MHIFWLNAFVYLILIKSYIVVNEVEIMPRGDGHGATSSLSKSIVGLMESLVHIHKGVDHSVAVSGRSWNILKHNRQTVWRNVLEIIKL